MVHFLWLPLSGSCYALQALVSPWRLGMMSCYCKHTMAITRTLHKARETESLVMYPVTGSVTLEYDVAASGFVRHFCQSRRSRKPQNDDSPQLLGKEGHVRQECCFCVTYASRIAPCPVLVRIWLGTVPIPHSEAHSDWEPSQWLELDKAGVPA